MMTRRALLPPWEAGCLLLHISLPEDAPSPPRLRAPGRNTIPPLLCPFLHA